MWLFDLITGGLLAIIFSALRPSGVCPDCAVSLRDVRTRAGEKLLLCPSCEQTFVKRGNNVERLSTEVSPRAIQTN